MIFLCIGSIYIIYSQAFNKAPRSMDQLELYENPIGGVKSIKFDLFI